MSDDAKLPKEALLLKLLNMTTVAEDTVAVVAIRRANALLDASGWTWEKLLQGKITVVGDPFGAIAQPPTEARRAPIPTPPATSPPRPTPSFRAATTASSFAPPPPRPAPTPKPTPTSAATALPLSSRNNRYGSDCYCCGDYVGANQGFLFKLSDFTKGDDTWRTACPTCNDKGEANLSSWPAPRTKRDWRDTLGGTVDINSL